MRTVCRVTHAFLFLKKRKKRNNTHLKTKNKNIMVTDKIITPRNTKKKKLDKKNTYTN
jgi:hypothetical protein